MANRPAKVTQAEVARYIRAAMQAGAQAVEVRPDGTVVVRLTGAPDTVPEVDDIPEVVL